MTRTMAPAGAGAVPPPAKRGRQDRRIRATPPPLAARETEQHPAVGRHQKDFHVIVTSLQAAKTRNQSLAGHGVWRFNEAGHGVREKRILCQHERVGQSLSAPSGNLIHLEPRNGTQVLVGRLQRGLHLGAVEPCAANQQNQHCRRQNELYPAREYRPILLHHFSALKTGCDTNLKPPAIDQNMTKRRYPCKFHGVAVNLFFRPSFCVQISEGTTFAGWISGEQVLPQVNTNEACTRFVHRLHTGGESTERPGHNQQMSTFAKKDYFGTPQRLAPLSPQYLVDELPV